MNNPHPLPETGDEVTPQVVRDAAADLLISYGNYGRKSTLVVDVRTGWRDDHSFVQAFNALYQTARADALREAGEDAARWRALIGCARVLIMGSAGFFNDHDLEDGYRHVGVEFWSHHPAASEQSAIDRLTEFADHVRALLPAKEANNG